METKEEKFFMLLIMVLKIFYTKIWRNVNKSYREVKWHGTMPQSQTERPKNLW